MSVARLQGTSSYQRAIQMIQSDKDIHFLGPCAAGALLSASLGRLPWRSALIWAIRLLMIPAAGAPVTNPDLRIILWRGPGYDDPDIDADGFVGAIHYRESGAGLNRYQILGGPTTVYTETSLGMGLWPDTRHRIWPIPYYSDDEQVHVSIQPLNAGLALGQSLVIRIGYEPMGLAA